MPSKRAHSPAPQQSSCGSCAVWTGVSLLLLAAGGGALVFFVRREDSRTEPSAGTPPPATPASPEVMELLSGLGLVEYSQTFGQKGLATVLTVSRQREDRGPSDVRPFHWRLIVKEARSKLQGKRATPQLPPDDTPAPPADPQLLHKEAKEDDDVELQPKARTMGECHVTRSFLKPSESNATPPIFWSFPGSGNTWIRFLIEQATGIYTGSVYQDLDIIKLMPGEMRCDKSVVALKGHPNWTPFDLVDGAYKPGGRYWNNGTDERNPIGSGGMDLDQWHGKETDQKTKRNIIRNFGKKCDITVNRALVVTRDPFAALWAEYQRMKSEVVVDGVKVGFGHTAFILKANFDPVDMRKALMSLTQDWMLQFVGYEGFIERNGCRSLLFQPFEEMTKKATRDFAVQRMCSFLERPMVTSPECAFRLADHPQIRRAKSKNPEAMTMEDAYNDPRVGDLICDMWEIAGREMEVLGYSPPKLGPRKGQCGEPRRASAALSRHTVLTSGTVNCRSDRVQGQTGADYFLVPDVYENTTTVKPLGFNDCSDCPKRSARATSEAAAAETETVLGAQRNERPYLTFAATGRNDNHSGNALERLQNQLINVVAYSARYKMYTEVIIVEWNPSPFNKTLPVSLRLPANLDCSYVTVRIISVPPALHQVAVAPHIHMPVQQYMGKNVAIRRAHGEFVICWNGDMLLTKHFWERAKRRDFKKGIYYRIDRLDMDKPLPKEFDVSDLEGEREEGFVQLHVYQIRTAVGTRELVNTADRAQFWHDFYNSNDTTGKFAERCCNSGCLQSFKSCRWMTWKSWSGDRVRAEVPKLLAKGDMKTIEDILNVGQHFHANAPGDFLMMHRDDWMMIRGYPEAPYQDEMDKYPMPQAFSMGMDQEILAPPIASIHQFHDSSWGAGEEMSSDMKDRPSLGARKYIDDGRDMLIRRKAVTLWADPTELGCNHKDWGFGNIAIRESLLVPLSTNSTRTSLRVVRQPFDQLEHAREPGCGWKYVRPPGARR
eukprot:TRINITY_DN42975_c0_g1_i1.p1 TRINITY_DN42975_c0_g1~~TRINITY_DN42975_c0_g1_i1.p1  ORF type:complete len:1017 (+),score=268.76 TRINITY_DN42975_c0_g1_i1:47-3052(+)